jgi:hypothetical protein
MRVKAGSAPLSNPWQPLRVGWLMKRGHVNKAFRERFFVLWPRALIYYKVKEKKFFRALIITTCWGWWCWVCCGDGSGDSCKGEGGRGEGHGGGVWCS